MFLPQVITAITGSLLGGKLAERFGTKRVSLAGRASSVSGGVRPRRAHGAIPLPG
jgi:hypothetical protein